MKLLVVLVLVAAAVARPDDAHYDSKYDNFNVDEIISNERLLKSYAHCFIGDGKCTPEANDIKKWIPEATKTSCAKCTDKQQNLIAKALKAIKEKLPTEFEVLYNKTDPEKKHTEDLQKFLDQHAN